MSSALQAVGGGSNGCGQWKSGDDLNALGGINYDVYNFVLDMSKDPPEQKRVSVWETGSQPASERSWGLPKPIKPNYYIFGPNVDQKVCKFVLDKTGVTGIIMNENH